MHTVITVNKVSLGKNHSLLISQGKREVAEFSRSSRLKKWGSFLLREDTSKLKFYLRFFILSCSRTEEDNKVATSYMWLLSKTWAVQIEMGSKWMSKTQYEVKECKNISLIFLY